MDSLQRYEFHAIFDRVTDTVDLEGCLSALGIENRLKAVRDWSKTKSKISKTKAGRLRFGGRAEWLDNLIEHDFAGRAIFEAGRDPHGIIRMTLKYGRQEARIRILAQKRAELRSRGAYAIVPRRVSRIPEYRRIATHRRRFRRERR